MDVDSEIQVLIEKNQNNIKNIYNSIKLDEIEFDISKILENNGIQYFNITAFEKFNNYKADILFQISPTKPTYVNNINI